MSYPVSRVAFSIAVLALGAILLYPYVNAEWGRPLGASYSGPEVQPRPIAMPASTLSSDELATVQVFEKVSRSVVFITNTALRRDFFSLNVFEVPQGSGSGFLWNQEGHIVTNFHVIYGADAIKVVLGGQEAHEARVVGIDPDHDLAVLQVRAPKERLVPIEIGTSRELRVGQKVLAIGNPFGLDHTLTTGVVSALGRTIKSMNNRTVEGVIQTDAAINPGNSGGPLLDSLGRLIGVNTQIISPSGAYAGIGFAVPVDTVNRIVPQLIKYGKLIRPGMGVALVPDRIAQQLGVDGLIIGRVSPRSPAERAGLRGTRERAGRLELGDVLRKLDGEPVKTAEDLLRILDRHKVGDAMKVEYLRDGRQLDVTVTLEAIEE
ncbi:MAG: trypsin-like peptidase domain-containing protein [Nitrospiraceae bacterium]|nr:trypsin-like peptidase domain-containing protein [Nitrospiraceae bacterium]